MISDRLFGQNCSSVKLAKYAFARGEVVFRRSAMESVLSDEDEFEDWNRGDLIYVQCEDSNATSTCHGQYSGEQSKL